VSSRPGARQIDNYGAWTYLLGMLASQPRHDKLLATVHAMREEYRVFLAVAPDRIQESDHVVLIGHWLHDVECSILPRALTATDDVTGGRWLALGETAVERVRVMLDAAQSEADHFDRG